MSPHHVIAASLGFMGIVFVAVGYPLWHDKIKPNSLYGFRIPATLKNPDAWYRANRVTGRDISYMGYGALVLAALLLLLQPPMSAAVTMMVVYVYGGVIWMLIDGFRAIKDTSLPGAPGSIAPPDASDPERRPPVR